MTRPVDEKIVALKIDNSDFKKHATETTGLLGKLKDSLSKIPGVRLGSSARDMAALGDATRNVPMQSLADAVNNVSGRFSAMGVVGMTVISNLTNRVVDMGIQMANSLVFDNIREGFSEYELKMNSIKTIMAGSGEDLDTVTGYLEELNTYADRTIYSFSDMTNSIGKFTNAGVSLEDSVSAIQGISNAAALSGAGAQEASHAMYNFAQALSAGHVKLIDWKSIENANMATVEFKNQLIETAVAAGTLEDAGDGMYRVLTTNGQGSAMDETINATKMFNDSLAYQWMTSEVLVGTLGRYADETTDIGKKSFEAAQKIRTFTQLMDTVKESVGSGFGLMWEHILGDYDEATNLFSKLGDVITTWVDKTMTSFNAFVGGIADGGGFLNLFAGIGNVLKPIGQFLGAIAKGIRDAFPGFTVDNIVKMTENFKSFSEKLVLSESALKVVSGLVTSFFNALQEGYRIVKDVGGALLALIPPGLIEGVADILAGVISFAAGALNGAEAGKRLSDSAKKISEKLAPLSGVLDRVNNSIAGFITRTAVKFSTFLERLGLDRLSDFFLRFAYHFEGIFAGTSNIFIAAWDGVKLTIKEVREKFGSLRDYISDVWGTIMEKLSVPWNAFKKLMGSFTFSDILSGGAAAGLYMLIKKFMDMFTSFSDIFSKVKDSAGGWEGIKGSLTGMFDGVSDSLGAFADKINAQNLLTIAAAVAILAVSLKLLEGLDTQDIIRGVAGLVSAMAIIAGGMKVLQSINFKGGFRSSVMIVSLAIAVNIMVSALRKINDMDPENLAGSLMSLVALTATLVGAMKALSSMPPINFTSIAGLVGLSVAVLILVTALKSISTIDPMDAVTGLLTVAAMLTAIYGFVVAMQTTVFSPKTALAIGILAIALSSLGSAIQKLANIGVGDLLVGISAMTYILLIATLITSMMDIDFMKGAIGFVILAAALNMIVIPVKVLGGMGWESLAKGILGMAAALGVLLLAGKLASTGLVGAVAITVMAFALTTLIPPFAFFAALSWGSILKGFVGFTLSIGALAAVSMLLTPAIPAMFGFAGAIIAFGAGIAIAGFGISLFATGLATLATLTVASIMSILGGIKLFIDGLADLLGSVGNFLVEFAYMLSDVFVTAAPTVINALLEVTYLLLQTVYENIPRFLEVGIGIIMALADGIIQYTGPLVQKGVEVIVALINGMADVVETEGPRLRAAVYRLVGEIVIFIMQALLELVNLIFGWIPGLDGVLTSASETATNAIRDHFNIDVAGEEKVNSLNSKLIDSEGTLQATTNMLGDSSEQGFREGFLADAVGEEKTNELYNALVSGNGDMNSAGVGLGAEGIAGFNTADTGGAGSNFVSGLSGGIETNSGSGSSLWSAAVGMGQRALAWLNSSLGNASPSKFSRISGVNLGEGLVLGIEDMYDKVTDSAGGLGQTAIDATNRFMDGLMADKDLEVGMRVVLDTTELDELSKMQSANRKVTVPGIAYSRQLVNEATPQQVVYNNEETHYNITINNPKPERSSDSVRKTLLKTSYGM